MTSPFQARSRRAQSLHSRSSSSSDEFGPNRTLLNNEARRGFAVILGRALGTQEWSSEPDIEPTEPRVQNLAKVYIKKLEEYGTTHTLGADMINAHMASDVLKTALDSTVIYDNPSFARSAVKAMLTAGAAILFRMSSMGDHLGQHILLKMQDVEKEFDEAAKAREGLQTLLDAFKKRLREHDNKLQEQKGLLIEKDQRIKDLSQELEELKQAVHNPLKPDKDLAGDGKHARRFKILKQWVEERDETIRSQAEKIESLEAALQWEKKHTDQELKAARKTAKASSAQSAQAAREAAASHSLQLLKAREEQLREAKEHIAEQDQHLSKERELAASLKKEIATLKRKAAATAEKQSARDDEAREIIDKTILPIAVYDAGQYLAAWHASGAGEHPLALPLGEFSLRSVTQAAQHYFKLNQTATGYLSSYPKRERNRLAHPTLSTVEARLRLVGLYDSQIDSEDLLAPLRNRKGELREQAKKLWAESNTLFIDRERQRAQEEAEGHQRHAEGPEEESELALPLRAGRPRTSN